MQTKDQSSGEPGPGESSLFGAFSGLSELVGDRRGPDGDGAHSHAVLRALVDHLPVLVYAKDVECRFIMANDEVARAMGAGSARDLIGKTDSDFYPREQADEFLEDDLRVLREGITIINKDEPRRTLAGETRWILTTKVPLRDGDDRIIGLVGVSKDITDRKRLEDERDRYIKELRAAAANVRTLRGLLPICAHCNHIRDDAGYWHRVEHYVQKHTHAEFSHGICPDCARKLYPEAARRFEAEERKRRRDGGGPPEAAPI